MKNLKKLGKVLSTKEQKNVNGGKWRSNCFHNPGSEGSGMSCAANNPCKYAYEVCFYLFEEGGSTFGSEGTCHCRR